MAEASRRLSGPGGGLPHRLLRPGQQDGEHRDDQRGRQPGQPEPTQPDPAQRRDRRQPDQPGQSRAGQDRQRGQAELDVSHVVHRLDERHRDQHERRHDQPGQRDRGRVERPPAVRPPGGQQASQRQQDERDDQRPGAREVGEQPLHRPDVGPAQPGDLVLLPAGQAEQRAEHEHGGRGYGQPPQRDPAGPAADPGRPAGPWLAAGPGRPAAGWRPGRGRPSAAA